MQELITLGWVVLIDLVLAADNALVIAALVAPLSPVARRAALVFGIAVAIIARGALSLCAMWLLALPYITVVGGIFLVWLAVKMLLDVVAPANQPEASKATKPSRNIIVAIVAADLSMSIDNVLAVGAAAQGHPFSLIVGLVGSMCLTGAAAIWLAGLMQRRPWIIFIGIAAIGAAGLRLVAAGLGHH